MSIRSPKSHVLSSLTILVVLVGGMICTPLLSAADVPTTSVTIVNNSSNEIRHIYLSPVDQENWGSDQLLNAVISTGGGSFTLNNLSCEASSIKVIAEDVDGCFLYKVVACSQATTWNITSADSRDCGN